MSDWKVSGAEDLPLAADDREWDGDEATDNIFEWATDGDEVDPKKVQKGHFAYNADEPDEQESYKLPFADVIDGELKAVPSALHAVAAVLEGSRGGVDLPDDVKKKVRDKVQKYYDKMGEKVPW